MKSFKNMPGRQNWTLRDWDTKDKKTLAKIILTDPEYYKELFEAQYSKVLTDNDLEKLQMKFRNDKSFMAKISL
jgi:hypothetical protein